MPKAKTKINKSEWIRKQPANLGARELVEKAAKENIKLTPQQVYTVRHHAAKQSAKPVENSVVKRGRKPKSAAEVSSTSKQHGSVSQEFIALATKLGSIEMTRLLGEWQQRQRA